MLRCTNFVHSQKAEITYKATNNLLPGNIQTLIFSKYKERQKSHCLISGATQSSNRWIFPHKLVLTTTTTTTVPNDFGVFY